MYGHVGFKPNYHLRLSLRMDIGLQMIEEAIRYRYARFELLIAVILYQAFEALEHAHFRRRIFFNSGCGGVNRNARFTDITKRF